MALNIILKKVLREISLSKQEEDKLWGIAEDVLKRIKKAGGEAEVGGSLAKGTLIKKEIQDIDIFVSFENEKETKKLEEILKKAGLKDKKVHGSRDYFQLNIERVLVEIIPIVKFSNPEKIKNVTDFSLSHVKYLKNKILRNKKLADEIKLAKVFCYANGCYGAESYISGFSGYALELLVLYFGSFAKFIKGIKKKRIIDIEKKFRNENEIKKELNESKLQSPVILIDPVYKYRNVCAGLSEETFDKFLIIAGKFLKDLGERFFEKKIFNADDMNREAKRKKARFLELHLKTDRQEGDIAGTKMKKFFKHLIKEFERKGQKIFNQEFIYSGGKDAEGYLIIRENKEVDIQGPEISMKEAVKSFKRARKKVYKEKGFYWAKEKIKIEEIIEALRKTGEEMGVSFIYF